MQTSTVPALVDTLHVQAWTVLACQCHCQAVIEKKKEKKTNKQTTTATKTQVYIPHKCLHVYICSLKVYVKF